MKIIFICSKSITFNTFLKSQADFFIKKGSQVIVSCSDTEKLDFSGQIYKINFPNNLINFFNIINYLRIYSQINKIIKTHSSGVFYIHTPLAAHLFRFFTFFKKLKIIYFVHGFRFTPQNYFLKNFIFKTIEKILSFNTNIFFTINNDDFNYVNTNFIKNKSCYKINGVGLNLSHYHFEKKLNSKSEIKKILVVAAYKKAKGYFEVLRTAELLKKIDVKFICYGYGNYNKFHSIKVKKKLDNITFNNFDKDLKNKIGDFDILLHLSKREGLPVAVMQSLSEGLPVICYNIRGNNDLIKNNINGFFINSYKDIPNLIYYLNIEEKFFNKVRFQAFKTINKEYLKENINLNIYNLIEKHYN